MNISCGHIIHISRYTNVADTRDDAESLASETAADIDLKSSHKKNVNSVIDVNPSKSIVTMQVHGAGVTPFHFSTVHKGSDAQAEVYRTSVQDSVVACLNGFNATIMCYGQTGSVGNTLHCGISRFLSGEIK